jgi:hypothetical protein
MFFSVPRRARGLRFTRLCRAIGLGFVALAAAARGADVTREYQIKAAFLYNFTRFVEWPAARFQDETSPIVIGVFGPAAFRTELESIVRDRKVNDRSIRVVPLSRARDALLVHAAFVPAGEEKLVEAGLASLLGAGVFLVGESVRFSDLGGTVTFTTEGNKLGFEINLAAAKHGGLKISAQVLKLAATVRRTL